MKLRRLRHRIFWKKGGLQRPCLEFNPQCIVCRYFKRKGRPAQSPPRNR